MKKILILVLAFAVLLNIGMMNMVRADISCTADSTASINLGETGTISLSCSGITSGVTVNVVGTYSQSCLSEVTTSSAALTQSDPSESLSFRAESMACQETPSDRTITWKFSTTSSPNLASKNTVVTINSPLSVTATFKNTSYAAVAGSSITMILEVSTSASQDINNINVNMSGTDSTLQTAGVTDKSISSIAASQGVQTQQVSWTITAHSAGTYSLNAVITSQNADSDTATAILTTVASGDGDGDDTSPGTGPSTGPSTTPSVTEVEETQTVTSITSGSTGTLSFSKEDDLGVQQIQLTVKEDATNVELKVKKESSKPASVTVPEDTVHSYITITASNITNENIETATIKFKVPKTWISSENIDKNSITLNRYSDNAWNALTTSLLSEDSSYVYYNAVTSGFSVFTITGKKIAEEAACTPGEKRCSGNDLQECNQDGTGWLKSKTCEYGCDSESLSCKLVPTCTSGEKRCLGNDLQECVNGEWSTKETCQYGCADNECKTQAEVSPLGIVDYTWILIIVVVIIIILAVVLLMKRR